MRKNHFFDISDLLKALFGVILNTLMVCTLVRVCAPEVVPGAETRNAEPWELRRIDAQQPELGKGTADREEADAGRRLEVEVERLRRENGVLRGELLEIRERLKKQDEDDRALRLWLAGVPAEGTVRKPGEREEQLLKSLGFVSRSGNELALKTAEFCDEVRGLLRELPIGKVRQAEIRLKLDAAAESARRMIGLMEYDLSRKENQGSLEACRVLLVDRGLSIAVLSVGSANGAFPGLIYRTGKNGTTRLRIVCVRPFVAAAEVLSGNIADLAPGMEAATEKHANRGER